MERIRSGLWYLLEWNDRDKCLLIAGFFALLQLSYWGLVNVITLWTDFGRHYVSPQGFAISQKVFAVSLLVWLAFVLWGWLLRRQQRQSHLYVTVFLYTLSLPLIATGHLVGLYNPVLGIMLLGAGLTGTILFDVRRIIWPFLVSVVIITVLAWLIVNYYLNYAPLLRLDPVSKFHVSGVWLLVILLISLPFVLGVFLVSNLLLSRWHEREDKVRVLSNTDSLTGLPNRRSLFDAIEQEMLRAKRNNDPFTLVMMDLDHFKLVNDQWGHATGDAALQQVSRLLPPLLRSFDLLGRVGGEEFVLALPRTQPAAAWQVIERCRAAIATSPVQLANGEQLHITASFGVCSVDILPPKTSLEKLLELADFALYEAKRKGRNCVESA